MIFIFILIFGVLFLFWNIRAIAPGNKGSLTAGTIVILLPICFFFREHFWACIGQAFLSVWLCEALLIYLGWWAVRFIRRAFRPKRPLPPSSAKRAARILLVASIAISAGMCIYGVHHNDDYVIRNAECRMQNAELESGDVNAECGMRNFVEASGTAELARALPSRSQNECEALMQNAELKSIADSLGRHCEPVGRGNPSDSGMDFADDFSGNVAGDSSADSAVSASNNSAFSIHNSEFTILFFSDLHLDPLFNGEKLQRMVQDAKRLHPDLILFGGDLADMHTDALNELGYDSLFRQLSAAATIAAIAVNGNHEGYMERSGSDPHGWLRQNGFIVLDDSTACTKVACITGRTDTQVARARGMERKTLAQLLPKNKTLSPENAQPIPETAQQSPNTTQLPPCHCKPNSSSRHCEPTGRGNLSDSTLNSALPWLLLDHQPKGIEPEYSGRLPDLALSGHTHDGQFFPGTIIINWVWRLAYGFGEIDGIKWLVTSGIGSWGPPVRVMSDTEMWFIEFRTK
ncbi:MAG: metallophosphoesterase [Fibrobacter sp.]|nr:metallophosphoesterase [Fibrobacter sp.]